MFVLRQIGKLCLVSSGGTSALDVKSPTNEVNDSVDYVVSGEGVYCLINNRDGLLGASNCVETFLIKSRHSSIW